MSIEAMKQWLAALENASEYIQAEHDQRKELYEPYGMVHKYSTEVQNLLDNKQAIKSLRQAIEQAEKQELVAFRYCCHSCFKANGGMMLDRMILCPECGNKRCPKASDHNFSCTGSNEPGQIGSIYSVSATVFVQEPATDEEMKRAKPVCADFFSFRAGVRYAESKFKEKRS